MTRLTLRRRAEAAGLTLAELARLTRSTAPSLCRWFATEPKADPLEARIVRAIEKAEKAEETT